MTQPTPARRALPAAVAVLVVLSLLPLKWLGWVGWFHGPAMTLLAPVAAPFSWLGRRLAATSAPQAETPEMRAIMERNEELRGALLREVRENERLRRQLEDLQKGLALNPEPVWQIPAQVFGSAADLAGGVLKVRVGASQGVTQNTVATAPGLQLVGRVIGVTGRTATIRPITDRAAGSLRAMVMLDEGSNGLLTNLSPIMDGTLQGDVEDRRTPDGKPIEPQVGQLVRLADPRWPKNADMLLVGKVEQVLPSPAQPLRRMVVVRPTIDRLDRLSEVVLRVTPQADGEEGRP